MQTPQLGIAESPRFLPPPRHLHVRAQPRGLQVRVLGPMLVSIGRLRLESLGGPKAGAYQAMGLFGFLFDRGPQGVAKDEVIEVIWPELELRGADTAFHRTVLGLRSVLSGTGYDAAVNFRNGRYFLSPGVIGWTDTWELERTIEASARTPVPEQRIRLLEQARTINFADYMDDCPYFGSSAFVEPRRRVWRTVRREVLRTLSELYRAADHDALSTLRRAEADAVASVGL